ncbi:MAG: hypothetical protein WDM77_01905 [Steroidobacteraceae bacterium]
MGITNANGTNVFTVYYRDEGGSVTGALPLVSGSLIAQLDLTQTATCVANNCTIAVGGSSASNGIADSFTGVIKAKSGLGITDVEPAALIGDNYPTAYSTTAYGHASPSQLAGLTEVDVFQQVFGIFVNKTGLNINAQNGICLPSYAITQLLAGNITDWSKVEDCVSHAAVASTPTTATIVNREAGSGSRTAASVFWLNDECVTGATGVLEDQATDYFSTGNVLSAAGTTSGAITYASIDQNGSTPNMVMVSIDGVFPTNLAAAQGLYTWWVESAVVTPNYAIPAVAASIANFMTADLQNANTAPHTAQINLIPNSGTNTTPSLPVAGTANTCSNASCTTHGTQAIYVNPFTKGSISCALPGSQL